MLSRLYVNLVAKYRKVAISNLCKTKNKLSGSNFSSFIIKKGRIRLIMYTNFLFSKVRDAHYNCFK